MPEPPREPTYSLRAPVSGAGILDPRTAALLWGSGSILLGLAVTILITTGNFRALTLLLLAILGIASLTPTRGVMILTVFLPFMYFVRRLILNFQGFSERDPILLFPAMATMGMFLGVLAFRGPVLAHYLRRSALLHCTAILMI